jgi:uncharacterized MnhB-related membrane protein
MGRVVEFIGRVSFLAAMPAVVGVFVALGMLLLVRRWQVQVLGMAILYFFVALLHTTVIRPEVALVKALIGWLICMTLYVTGLNIGERDDDEERKQRSRRRWWPLLEDGAPLRIVVLLAVFVIAYAGSAHFSLPQVPGYIGLACYLLGMGGLFLAGMTEDPLQVGLGLLVFMLGFDLFFGALEPSLAVAGLMGAGGFLIALAVTFLAVIRATVEEEKP